MYAIARAFPSRLALVALLLVVAAPVAALASGELLPDAVASSSASAQDAFADALMDYAWAAGGSTATQAITLPSIVLDAALEVCSASTTAGLQIDENGVALFAAGELVGYANWDYVLAAAPEDSCVLGHCTH